MKKTKKKLRKNQTKINPDSKPGRIYIKNINISNFKAFKKDEKPN